MIQPDVTIEGPALSGESFEYFARFVNDELGIKMSDAKVPMLRSRLLRRLRDLNLQSLDEYRKYLFDREHIEDEQIHFIDAVTTNKTDFFREPRHFDYLTEVVVPEYQRSRGRAGSERFLIWSAGCSTGEEPYTLAMVMSEYSPFSTGISCAGISYAILATDISTRVLEHAQLGIYDEARIEPISQHLRMRYLSRSKDKSRRVVRVVPEIRNKVSFHRLNFMSQDYGIGNEFDVIFCRNVLIYFEKATQERVVIKLCRSLRTGGYLFVGHSELLTGLNVPVTLVAPAVYRKI